MSASVDSQDAALATENRGEQDAATEMLARAEAQSHQLSTTSDQLSSQQLAAVDYRHRPSLTPVMNTAPTYKSLMSESVGVPGSHFQIESHYAARAADPDTTDKNNNDGLPLKVIDINKTHRVARSAERDEMYQNATANKSAKDIEQAVDDLERSVSELIKMTGAVGVAAEPLTLETNQINHVSRRDNQDKTACRKTAPNSQPLTSMQADTSDLDSKAPDSAEELTAEAECSTASDAGSEDPFDALTELLKRPILFEVPKIEPLSEPASSMFGSDTHAITTSSNAPLSSFWTASISMATQHVSLFDHVAALKNESNGSSIVSGSPHSTNAAYGGASESIPSKARTSGAYADGIFVRSNSDNTSRVTWPSNLIHAAFQHVCSYLNPKPIHEKSQHQSTHNSRNRPCKTHPGDLSALASEWLEELSCIRNVLVANVAIFKFIFTWLLIISVHYMLPSFPHLRIEWILVILAAINFMRKRFDDSPRVFFFCSFCMHSFMYILHVSVISASITLNNVVILTNATAIGNLIMYMGAKCDLITAIVWLTFSWLNQSIKPSIITSIHEYLLAICSLAYAILSLSRELAYRISNILSQRSVYINPVDGNIISCKRSNFLVQEDLMYFLRTSQTFPPIPFSGSALLQAFGQKMPFVHPRRLHIFHNQSYYYSNYKGTTSRFDLFLLQNSSRSALCAWRLPHSLILTLNSVLNDEIQIITTKNPSASSSQRQSAVSSQHIKHITFIRRHLSQSRASTLDPHEYASRQQKARRQAIENFQKSPPTFQAQHLDNFATANLTASSKNTVDTMYLPSISSKLQGMHISASDITLTVNDQPWYLACISMRDGQIAVFGLEPNQIYEIVVTILGFSSTPMFVHTLDASHDDGAHCINSVHVPHPIRSTLDTQDPVASTSPSKTKQAQKGKRQQQDQQPSANFVWLSAPTQILTEPVLATKDPSSRTAPVFQQSNFYDPLNLPTASSTKTPDAKHKSKRSDPNMLPVNQLDLSMHHRASSKSFESHTHPRSMSRSAVDETGSLNDGTEAHACFKSTLTNQSDTTLSVSSNVSITTTLESTNTPVRATDSNETLVEDDCPLTTPELIQAIDEESVAKESTHAELKKLKRESARQLAALRNEIYALNETVERDAATETRAKSRMVSLADQVRQIESSMVDTETKIRDLRVSIDVANQEHVNQENTVAVLRDTLRDTESSWQAIESSQEKTLHELQEIRDDLRRQIDEIAREIEQLEERYVRTSASMSASYKERKRIAIEKRDATRNSAHQQELQSVDALHERRDDIEKYEEECRQLCTQIDAMRATIEEEQHFKRKLQEELDRLMGTNDVLALD